jgi:hypothetical protein
VRDGQHDFRRNTTAVEPALFGDARVFSPKIARTTEAAGALLHAHDPADPEISVEQTTLAGGLVKIDGVHDDNDPSPQITLSRIDEKGQLRPVGGNSTDGWVLPLGTTELILGAEDASGNAASKPVTVTVVDSTPPKFTQQLALLGCEATLRPAQERKFDKQLFLMLSAPV